MPLPSKYKSEKEKPILSTTTVPSRVETVTAGFRVLRNCILMRTAVFRKFRKRPADLPEPPLLYIPIPEHFWHMRTMLIPAVSQNILTKM